MRNKAVFALGGGRLDMNRPVMEKALEATGSEHPRVVVVPAARSTERSYKKMIKQHNNFFEQLGILYEPLHPFLGRHQNTDTNSWSERIQTADLVHIAGGNYPYLQRLWRRLGVTELMRQSLSVAPVVSGVSAGALALTTEGLSDPNGSYKNLEKMRPYKHVNGLGIMPVAACVHYHDINDNQPKQRREVFHEMVQDGTITHTVPVGIDSGAALARIEDDWQVVSGTPEASVYHVSITDSGAISETDLR